VTSVKDLGILVKVTFYLYTYLLTHLK